MAKEKSVEKVVSKHLLLGLIKEANATKTKIGELSGSLGERVKTASENGHLHKAAFANVVKLSRMEELKRRDFLRQRAIYEEMAQEAGLFGDEHAGDLVDEAEEDQSDEGEDDADVRPGFLQDRDKAAADANAAALGGIKSLPDGEKPKRRAPKPKGVDAGAPLEGADAPGDYSIQ